MARCTAIVRALIAAAVVFAVDNPTSIKLDDFDAIGAELARVATSRKIYWKTRWINRIMLEIIGFRLIELSVSRHHPPKLMLHCGG